MKPACPRQWQVEAARDGRLSDDDMTRFEAHRTRCTSCRQEALHMESVAELVRRNERPQLDDLSLRRLRQRLLASAAAASKSPAASALSRSKFVVAVAVPAIFAGSLVFLPRVDARSSTTIAAPSEATVVVHAVAAAAREPASVRVPQATAAISSSTPAAHEPKSSPARRPPQARGRAPKTSVPGTIVPPRAMAESGVAEEDLAYLQILALLEEGRREEAVLAAHSYLARFPDGFRRPEVRTITRGR